MFGRGTLAFSDGFAVAMTIDTRSSNAPYLELRHEPRCNTEVYAYQVRLLKSTPHYGGVRWWYACPLTGRRVAKLYLPLGGYQFWSRQAYRLGYASQRGTALDRAHRRVEKLERRLWWDECDNPYRPPGMRRRTFDRLVAKWEAAHERLDAAWLPGTERLLARLSGIR